MIERTYKISSATLTSSNLLKLFKILDEERKKVVEKEKEYCSLSFDFELKNSTSIKSENQSEISAIVEDEVENIKKISIRFYSSNLKIHIYEYSLRIKPLELEISTNEREKLLILEDKIKTLLVKQKNWNWIVSNDMLSFALLLFFFSFIAIKLFRLFHPEKVSTDSATLLGFIIFFGSGILAWLTSSFLARQYPPLVIKSGGGQNGRNIKKDMWGIIIVIAIPIIISVL